jgi:hypothetical protein
MTGVVAVRRVRTAVVRPLKAEAAGDLAADEAVPGRGR